MSLNGYDDKGKKIEPVIENVFVYQVFHEGGWVSNHKSTRAAQRAAGVELVWVHDAKFPNRCTSGPYTVRPAWVQVVAG